MTRLSVLLLSLSLAVSAQTVKKAATITGLPPGITLSSAGLLSGTPTASGTYQFTVQACDSALPSNCGSQLFTLSIAGAVVVPPMPLPVGIVNKAYSAPLQATGGSGTYTWSVQ